MEPFESPPSRTRSVFLFFCIVIAAGAVMFYLRANRSVATQTPVVAERKIASVAKPAPPPVQAPAMPAPNNGETIDPNAVKVLAAAEAKLTELEKNLQWMMEQKEKFGVPSYLLDDLENREHELAQIDNDTANAKTAHADAIKSLDESARAANASFNSQLAEVQAKIDAQKRDLEETKGEIRGAQRRTAHEELQQTIEQHKSLVAARNERWAKYQAERSSAEADGLKKITGLAEQREAKLNEIAQIRQNLQSVKSQASQDSSQVAAKVEAIKREIASQKQTIEDVRAKLNR